MGSTAHEAGRAVRRLFLATRTVGGIAGGVLVVQLTAGVVTLFLVVAGPALLTGAEVGTAGVGLGLVLGGATARLLAGARLREGWIGIGCALAFITASLLWPRWGWIVVPGTGWFFALSPQGVRWSELAGGAAVRAYPHWLWLTAAVPGAALAWLGDRWVARRWGPEGRQVA